MARLHEYQSKQILATHGIEIPRGELAQNSSEVGEIADKLNKPVVIKAQIHSTSRAASGGIKFAKKSDEAFQKAEEIFANKIDGNKIEAVLVDEKLDIEHEFYLGFIIDDRLKRPTLLFSESGGSGIEERAATLKTLVCSIRCEPNLEEIGAICNDEKIAEILQKLYRVAKFCEARVAEINPLALTKDGKLIALDARISVDDYAVFRHEDLKIEMARELGHTPTRLEKIAWEFEKDDFRGTFYFVEILPTVESQASKAESNDQQKDLDSRLSTLDYKIGFHGAGGGGSMASLDAAQRNDLSPACYVDTSGNPPASKVYRAAKIILSIPEIKGYFLSGSGVASQEQFGLARAVLKAFLEVKPNIPAVLRLGGNGEEMAKELVERYAKFLPAPIEAYRKKDSADFCANRLHELIVLGLSSQVSSQKCASLDCGLENWDYEFKTKTGTISFDYSKLDEVSAAKIVASCPNNILKLDENNKLILAIEVEEAERGKCSECLACEFASLDLGLNAVKIDFPIECLKNG